MNTIHYNGYTASISYSNEDECFVGRVIGITDVIGFHGDNVPELKQSFEESIDGYVKSCKRIGKAPEKSYSGKFTLRIDSTLHANIASAASNNGKSINQWLNDVLSSACA